MRRDRVHQRTSRHSSNLALGLVAGLGLALGAAPAGAVEIGSVAAANPTIEGTPPGDPTRRLELGARLYFDEQIVTSEMGSGQFIFLDKTTLTVSPRSEIVLDQYVYDPERDVGEIALSVSKGVLRFIGGRITKTSEATVTTPHATIGIRGGIMAVTVGQAGTNAVFLAGSAMRVTGQNRTITVTKSGGMVSVSQSGEASYEGQIGGEQLATIYESSETEGDGGTTEPVESETVETMASTSGLTEAGTGSPDATQPTTTTTTDQQTGDTTQDDPISDVRSEPETSPISGGPGDGVAAAQPIPGLTGQAFVAPTAAFTTTDGTQIADPEAQRVVEAPGSAFPFAEVLDGSRRGVTAADESFLVPTPDVLGFYQFGEAFPAATLGNGSSPFGSISGVGFRDPMQDFTVAAFETNTAEPRRGFTFFGMPTPGQLVQTFPEAVTARLYDLSPDFLWGLEAPLPPEFGDVFDIAGGTSLYLVPEPNGTFLGDTTQLGFNNNSNSKWLYGFLDIRGSGANQSVLLAGLSARILPSGDGTPTANDSVRSFFSLAGGATVASQRLVAGNVQDPEGNTFFGDNGQYVLWGTSSSYLGDNADPDIDFSANSYTAYSRNTLPDGQSSDQFGTLRLATLDGTEALGGVAARAPLGVPISDTDWIPSGANVRALTGGYAAGAGQSHIPTGASVNEILPDPYVFRSPDGDSVRMAFDAGANATVAEFGAMDVFGSPDIFDITLNFGNGSSRDAMLDDTRFEMDEALLPTGELTGQAQSISGLSGTPVNTAGHQTAARSTLLSAGLVGDGGIFPTGTDTTPEWLRWGWWGASYQFADADPGDFAGRTEIVPVGTWVSGVKSDIAALGTSGSATFDGLATAHITETGGAGTASYVAGGRYLMTFDFGSRSGTASINGLIDPTLVATVSEAGATAGNHFGGTLRDAATFDAVGAIDGSFFAGGGDPSAATAGAFDFERPIGDGVTQAGAGIFAADKQ